MIILNVLFFFCKMFTYTNFAYLYSLLQKIEMIHYLNSEWSVKTGNWRLKRKNKRRERKKEVIKLINYYR